MSRVLTAFALAALLGAAPPAQPPRPDLPAINPAGAKLLAATDLGSPLTGVAFADGKGVLLAGGEDGRLRRWVTQQGKELLAADTKPAVLEAHTAVVTAVAAVGATAVSASSDGKLLVWNLPADRPAHTLAAGTPVRALALSADGKVLACGGDDGHVGLFDPVSGRLLKK